MKGATSWWRQAGTMLDHHPELMAASRGIRGFGAGALWMHRAMTVAGWRMPPFSGRGKYADMGWLKYGICSGCAALSAISLLACGLWWIAPVVAATVFYAAEAQMVFLFPESLLGRRAPWTSARALTFSAGGTWRVMAGVLPIAAGMLATGWWRGRSREAWVQGCLAVVIWHRQVAVSRKCVVESPEPHRLDVGTAAPLLLRREQVRMEGTGTFRVLWISDLHWRGTGDVETLLALRRIVRRERPDTCILGGDFIERPAALPLLRLLVKCLAGIAPCVALPGNHDRGRFAGPVRDAILAAGGHWLPDMEGMALKNALGGRLEIVSSGAPAPQEPIRRVVAVHDPAELDDCPPASGALVLAGHLHGGQWVISAKDGRLLPAAWFYQHAWLRREHAGAEWIVSRGAGDTFPLRWNCPREVILCEIS